MDDTPAAPAVVNAPPTILCVDDEPNILSALKRLFRPSGYRVLLAEGGALGLAVMEQEAVDLVVSDMRMPGMDGAQFLGAVRARWPATARILLTGYADMASTIDAINQGEIYRYVTKPWVDTDLLMTVRQALERQQLERDKRRLEALTQAQNEQLSALNNELEGKVRQRTAQLQTANDSLAQANDRLKTSFLTSIKVFAGLIELRHSAVAGHSRRVAALGRSLALKVGLDNKAAQDVFVAGLLHDIGKIGLPDKLLGKPVRTMTQDELVLYRKHPLTGVHALMALDELGPAAKLMRHHHERYDGHGFPDGLKATDIPLGARVLAVANDYDSLQIGTFSALKFSPQEAKEAMDKDRGRRYDPQVLDALFTLTGAPPKPVVRENRLRLSDLKPGMALARDFMSAEGVLLLGADHLLDQSLIDKMQAHEKSEGLMLTVWVKLPKDD